MTRPPWPYDREFKCHRCGNCCRGDGYVDMTESDIARAAQVLAMTRQEFLLAYCQYGSDGYILRDQEDEEQSCIFLTNDDGLAGCRIHEAKPEQCATFPFGWRPRNVMQFCEGMRAVARLPKPARSSMTPKK
ncbi:YkgJ family cysteine cluster protein [Candidatus Sumerlaeota bacterium]|nr:YkgJ family cysteine cluster protein [Candidatus Sumerlaeota bacterium]